MTRRNKYGAIPVTIDGHRFASKMEARRCHELKMLVRAGEISHLRLQPQFPLRVNGHVVGRYTADFEYTENGATVVEEVKSAATAKATDYRFRVKVFRACYPDIDLREIVS